MAHGGEQEEIRKELECTIYPLYTLQSYKYVVVCSFFNGNYVLSKHKTRDTWETQGGHIEEGESSMDAARRELFEESGILDAELYPVCDYVGCNSGQCANGIVYAAVVHAFSDLPEFEMEKRAVFEKLPENLTYPKVTPKLFQCARAYFKHIE